MIIGTILRNYKCYEGINYIPVSNGTDFSAYIGENGAGKSTVLEALDIYFNGGAWNVNNDAQANGLSTRWPHICLVVALEKKKWNRIAKTKADQELLPIIELLSNILWNAKLDEFNSANKEQAKKFIFHRESLVISEDTHFLCAVGQEYDSPPDKSFLSIFRSMSTIHTLVLMSPSWDGSVPIDDELDKLVSNISKFIRPNYNYIYTPAEVDVQRYTKIESKAIQKLSGKDIEAILKGIIGQPTLDEINKKLADFIKEIEAILVDYQYKKPTQRQSKLNFSDLSQKVIESYFSIRVLNKSDGGIRTPVNLLSSGEKKKALVDISYAFLSKNNNLDTEVVFAMDEPEASLHTGAIFEQFERIYQISELGVQCLLTTHWYGFVPILTTGAAINIYKEKDEILNTLLDIAYYRETVKQQNITHKGALPADISLKSRNDLVQTIIASIRKPLPYSWIICEGTTERIYFEHYFSYEIDKQELKILPVGGAKEVKRLFEYLELPIKEDAKQVTGKVLCLIDTDVEFMECDFQDYPNLKFRRLLDLANATHLVKGGHNQKTPTDVEDSLDADYFLQTMYELRADHEDVQKLVDNIEIIDLSHSAASAFNWRRNEREALKALFQEEGFKFRFANEYVKFVDREDPFHSGPAWITEIRKDLI
ncbi:AAA family ATPase [Pseudomonas sp. AK106]